MKVLDLAKVFVVDTSVENSGQATILIKKEHVDLWGIDLDELNRVAEENTERMFPAMTLELLEFPNSPIGFMVRSEKFREEGRHQIERMIGE